jgi:exodeoxyribonuclease-3
LKKVDPDVVCIQETKAQEHQLEDAIFYPEDYHCYYFDAEKKGYSGVAIYSKQKPNKIHTGLGWDHVDSEGRWIQVDYDGLSVASLYLPSGSSSEERQANKLKFMDRFMEDLNAMKRKRREFIICGDWNMVHKAIDIKNFKGNIKNSGCTQVERDWMENLFTKAGWVDAFRVVNQEADQYTWWSNRGRAREKNVGWRIDYQIATPGIAQMATKERIYTAQRFSDHAPLIVDYAHEL